MKIGSCNPKTKTNTRQKEKKNAKNTADLQLNRMNIKINLSVKQN